MEMNLDVGHVVDHGFAPLRLDQNSSNRPSSSEARKTIPQQNIRVESPKGDKNADDDLNPSWSDYEDGDDKELVIVAATLPKVEIQSVEKCAPAVDGKAVHPQRFGRIIDVSPPLPKKDAFKRANPPANGKTGHLRRVGRIIDVNPTFPQKDNSQLNAAQPLVTGATQSFARAQPTPEGNNISYGPSQPVRNVNGNPLSFRPPRWQAYCNAEKVHADAAKNFHRAVAELNRSGEAGETKAYGLYNSTPLLEKTFIDEKAKEAAIHGCNTFTNAEMRRLAEFAQKLLGIYTGISGLLIGKAWS